MARMIYLRSLLVGAGAFVITFIGSSFLALWSAILFPHFMRQVFKPVPDDTGHLYFFAGKVMVWPPGWFLFGIGIVAFAGMFYWAFRTFRAGTSNS